jgi:hypothetical protein
MTRKSRKPGIGARSTSGSLRTICLAVLGGLTAMHVSEAPHILAAGAFAGVLVGAVGVMLLRWMLSTANPALDAKPGTGAIRAAIDKGFLMLLPFTALAAVAELLLGWNAVQAFSCAALLTAATAATSEVVALGGGRLRNAVIATVIGTALSTAWIIGSMFLGALQGLA